jgi:restriction endonuclease
MPHLSFGRLSAVEFEEFCFDLLHALGFLNIDWRKGTPLRSSPADSGRDIVAYEERIDVDGSKHHEKWFVDCKHYKRGVPPNELRSLLTWAEADRPDIVLFMISGYLSNPAKGYLHAYQANNRPPFKIKYWEKPQLERLSQRKASLLRRYNLADIPIRSVKAILKAEEEFFYRVWYDRKLMLLERIRERRETISPELKKGMLQGMRYTEKKYGKRTLGPYDKFQWGMINGKLSALRWVLGDDWDMLDT